MLELALFADLFRSERIKGEHHITALERLKCLANQPDPLSLRREPDQYLRALIALIRKGLVGDPILVTGYLKRHAKSQYLYRSRQQPQSSIRMGSNRSLQAGVREIIRSYPQESVQEIVDIMDRTGCYSLSAVQPEVLAQALQLPSPMRSGVL